MDTLINFLYRNMQFQLLILEDFPVPQKAVELLSEKGRMKLALYCAFIVFQSFCSRLMLC